MVAMLKCVKQLVGQSASSLIAERNWVSTSSSSSTGPNPPPPPAPGAPAPAPPPPPPAGFLKNMKDMPGVGGGLAGLLAGATLRRARKSSVSEGGKADMKSALLSELNNAIKGGVSNLKKIDRKKISYGNRESNFNIALRSRSGTENSIGEGGAGGSGSQEEDFALDLKAAHARRMARLKEKDVGGTLVDSGIVEGKRIYERDVLQWQDLVNRLVQKFECSPSIFWLLYMLSAENDIEETKISSIKEKMGEVNVDKFCEMLPEIGFSVRRSIYRVDDGSMKTVYESIFRVDSFPRDMLILALSFIAFHGGPLPTINDDTVTGVTGATTDGAKSVESKESINPLAASSAPAAAAAAEIDSADGTATKMVAAEQQKPETPATNEDDGPDAVISAADAAVTLQIEQEHELDSLENLVSDFTGENFEADMETELEALAQVVASDDAKDDDGDDDDNAQSPAADQSKQDISVNDVTVDSASLLDLLDDIDNLCQ